MSQQYTDRLSELGACPEGLVFAYSKPSLDAAWRSCRRPDWMLWLLGATCKSVSRKRQIVNCCLDILEFSCRPRKKDDAAQYQTCLDACRDWASGRGNKRAVKKAREATFGWRSDYSVARSLWAVQDLCAFIIVNNLLSDLCSSFVGALHLKRGCKRKVTETIISCFPEPPEL